jgi:hypothetical protein
VSAIISATVARLLVFVGCLVSVLASGRFTIRLFADGIVSFAFLPVTQLLAVTIAWRVGSRPSLPFRTVIDEFSRGFWPWLIWITLLSAVFGMLAPRASAVLVRPAIYLTLLPMFWSLRIDFEFFRDVKVRAPRAALVDLLIQRTVSWGVALTYFFGIAVRPEIPWVLSLLGIR